MEVMSRGESFQGIVSNMSADERAILEPQGIKSILAVPIFVDGSWWGFIGFDDTERERGWDRVEEESIQAAASIVGAAVQHCSSEQSLRESEAKFRSLVSSNPDHVTIYR